MIRIEFNSSLIEFTWRLGRKSTIANDAFVLLERQLTHIFENPELTPEMRNRAYVLSGGLRIMQSAVSAVSGGERFNRNAHITAQTNIGELVTLAGYVDDEMHSVGIEPACATIRYELNMPSVNFELCGGHIAVTMRPKPKLPIPKFWSDWRANRKPKI